jgi:hypothetical protein
VAKEKTDTVPGPGPVFAVYANLPEGWITTAFGVVSVNSNPLGRGNPDGSTAYSESEFPPAFVT